MHVEWVKLVEFHENLLSPGERAAVETHLASGCAFCQARLAQLQGATSIEQFITGGEVEAGDSLMETPAELMDKAVSLFARRSEPDPVRTELSKPKPVPEFGDRLAAKVSAVVERSLAAFVRLAPAEGDGPVERSLARNRRQLRFIERRIQKRKDGVLRQALVQVEFTTLREMASILDLLERHREARDVKARALFLARSFRHEEDEGLLLRELGTTYFKLGEFRLSLGNFSRSLTIARKGENAVEVYHNTRNLGCVYSRLAEHGDAVRHFEEAIQLAKSLGRTEDLGVDLHNLSIGYRNLARYAEALRMCDEALALERERNDEAAQAYSHVSRSNILASLGNHEEAVTACERALRYFESQGNERDKAMCLLNLGNSFNELGRFEDALECCKTAVGLKKRAQDDSGAVAALIEQGRAERGLGRLQEAFRTHRQAEILCARLDSQAMMGEVKEELAQDLYQAGDYDQALDYGAEALVLAETTQDDVLKLKTYFQLARVYCARNEIQPIQELYSRARNIAGMLARTDEAAFTPQGAAGGTASLFQMEYPRFLEGLRAAS